ncbi:thermophilic serine proteinase precursor [bacterium BMS3Abin06]|nr:thermophilic serine proteinase precursor [bacterium BMS3Abin06]
MKKNKGSYSYLFLIALVFSAAAGLVFPVNIAVAGNISSADTVSMIDSLLSAEHIEGELIVKFRNDIAMDSALLADVSEQVHSRIGSVIEKEFGKLKGLQQVKVPGNVSLRQALKYYLANPQVEYVEPNYIVHADLLPNDTSFSQLWGLNNTGQTGGTNDADIDAPEAWDLTTGSGSVVIAVVDTGVDYNHTDLNSNIWTNTGETNCSDGIDNDANGYVDDCRGWDFANNDNNPMDDNNHGTHVSGTIAAEGNNANGVTGVNWTASIMPLKFLDANGSGSTANAISAILYANANGADVISNSWGGGGYSQALKDAIDASPAVVVCAAGNDGTNNDSIAHYPSNYTSVNLISVAATTDTDGLASFSNYGVTSVDIGAPGVSIYSTVRNNGYASYSGTSMATPHVSGVAGLVKALNPAFSNLEIRSRVLNTADPINSLSGKVATGGRLNAYNALTGVVTAPDISATPPNKDFGTATVGSVSAVQVFTISNDGTSDLVIGNNIYLTAPNPYQFSLQNDTCAGATLIPGASCTMEAQYVPTKTGTMYSDIAIGSNDPDTPKLYIALTGTGVQVQDPDISVTPSSVDFGYVTVGNSSDQIVTVENVGVNDLIIGSVTLPLSPFSITADNCSGLTLVSSATCTITYRFSPASEATFVSSSNIPSNDPDTPDFTVSLTGVGITVVEPDISASPANRDFGTVDVGSVSAVQVFTISNTGALDLVLRKVYLTGPNPYQFSLQNDTCAGATLIPGASCTMEAQYVPTKAGTMYADIAIGSNDPDTPKLYIALTGTGVQVQGPDISATPVSKDFGIVAVGSVSVVQVFTISNTGASNLVIGGVYLTGPNPYQFSLQNDTCGGTTLIPGASCTMEAQYVPTKTGLMYAKIGIDSNDPDTPHLYVDLNGTGQ